MQDAVFLLLSVPLPFIEGGDLLIGRQDLFTGIFLLPAGCHGGDGAAGYGHSQSARGDLGGQGGLDTGACGGLRSRSRCGGGGRGGGSARRGAFGGDGGQDSGGGDLRSRSLQRQQTDEEGQRCKRIELRALLLQVPDLDLHLLASVVQAALDRVLGAAQGLGDLLHAHLLVIEHADDQPLILAEGAQDLPHQPGGLLPVQDQLGIVVGPLIPEVDLAPVLRGHLAEEDGLFPLDVVLGLIGGDPPDPGAEILPVRQPVQILEGGHIGVLHDVQNGVLILEQEFGGPVYVIVGKGIELFDRVPVALGGPVHGLFGDLVHGDPSLMCLIGKETA